MKLLMAVSSDGFLAAGPDDNMRWTGVTDKAIFRLLTLTSDQPIFAGWKTAQMLPPLHDRVVHPLSRRGLTLASADGLYPGSWLIGGPTVAFEALKLGLVTQAVICRVPATLYKGVLFNEIVSRFSARPAHTIRFGDVNVEIFTPRIGGT